jgi:hypothetical protein
LDKIEFEFLKRDSTPRREFTVKLHIQASALIRINLGIIFCDAFFTLFLIPSLPLILDTLPFPNPPSHIQTHQSNQLHVAFPLIQQPYRFASTIVETLMMKGKRRLDEKMGEEY